MYFLSNHMKFFYFLTLFATICLTSSCSPVRHFNFVETLLASDAPNEIKQGTYDGCQTAIWSRGNHFYRVSAEYKQDSEMIKNPIYSYSWQRAYIQCFMIITVNNYQNIDSEIVNNRLAYFADPRDAKNWQGLPIGGDETIAPQFVLSQNTNDALNFNHQGQNGTDNLYGFFGTCQFC
jgi:hypothetical protein